MSTIETINLLLVALGETGYMVFTAGLLSSLFGIPLGFVLFCTRQQGIFSNPGVNKVLSTATNILRSIPFIILLVAILPFTRLLVGTGIGTNAAIVPLAVCAIAFIARIVENVLEELPTSLIEAALSLGATPLQIMYKVLWPEALPGIINGLTLTLVTLVGYSAMAGTVGGGGLGDVGIRYGYQRFDPAIMLFTVILLIMLVQGIQVVGNFVSTKVNKR